MKNYLYLFVSYLHGKLELRSTIYFDNMTQPEKSSQLNMNLPKIVRRCLNTSKLLWPRNTIKTVLSHHIIKTNLTLQFDVRFSTSKQHISQFRLWWNFVWPPWWIINNPPATQFLLLKTLSWTNLSITFEGFFFEVPIIKIAHFLINWIYLWENDFFLLWAPPNFFPFKSDG